MKLRYILDILLIITGIVLISLKGFGFLSCSWWVTLLPLFIFILIPGEEYSNKN